VLIFVNAWEATAFLQSERSGDGSVKQLLKLCLQNNAESPSVALTS
jgi:hypothetical protein